MGDGTQKKNSDFDMLVFNPERRDKKVDADAKQAKAAPEVKRPDELVLVVEDSRPSSAVLALILRKLGFDVVECANGTEARHKLDSMPPEEIKRLKAIFSDYMMPEMNGFELLTYVRQRSRVKQIPFFICTSISDRAVMQQAAALTSTAYLLKPLSFEKMRKVVDDVFPERKLKAG
jgi:CheY-like chemotaxis protein